MGDGGHRENSMNVGSEYVENLYFQFYCEPKVFKIDNSCWKQTFAATFYREAFNSMYC